MMSRNIINFEMIKTQTHRTVYWLHSTCHMFMIHTHCISTILVFVKRYFSKKQHCHYYSTEKFVQSSKLKVFQTMLYQIQKQIQTVYGIGINMLKLIIFTH